MGKVFDAIDAKLEAFITGQPMFFVATAPRDEQGHINLSPKGIDGLRVLGPGRVAYLDHVGSGAETIAHLRENGRIVLMLCAFEGPPRIVRLHGRGTVIEPQDPEYAGVRPLFPADRHVRAIVVVDVARVSDSCGFGVPLLTCEAQRPQLLDWAENRGPGRLQAYQREKNARSIDGLPALRWTEEVGV